MAEEPVCRICRCEGTEDAPLFHPCKCRGSIKYIHQDCLIAWLEHSKKESCDICHAPYSFKTVYDPKTPDVLPIMLILSQALKSLGTFLYHVYVCVLIVAILVIQVPTFVACIDRLLDWQLGCEIPNGDFQHGLLYGEDVRPEDIAHLSSLVDKAILFFTNTWLSGLLTFVKYSVVLGAMVLIQGSILSDEGFTKIVHKRIGPEPRLESVFEMLRRNRLRRIQRRQQLQGENNGMAGAAAAGAAAAGFVDNELDDELARQEDADNEEERMNLHELREIMQNANRILDLPPPHRVDHRDGDAGDVGDAGDADRIRFNNNEMRGGANNNMVDDEEDILDEALDGAFFDGDKGPSFVVQIAIFLHVAALGALICLKTVPSLMGMLAISFADSVAHGVYAVLKQSTAFNWALGILATQRTNILPYITETVRQQKVLSFVLQFINDQVIQPVISTYINSINWTPTTSLFERRSVIGVGFSTVGLFIWWVMHHMEAGCSQNNPLRGSYRSIYIVLLEFVCILKVFALVMIEWLLFPLFCGFQVEYALVPFFNENLFTYKIEPSVFGLLSLGYLPQWLLGTLFMYLFASFVNMIRSSILRRGVLFFIRPSDDPNIRLVHDALMRPFALKLSHIALSAGVYALYITIEFTLGLWAVRLLSPVDILPALPRFSTLEWLLYTPLFFAGDSTLDRILAYWRWVFKWSCSKLRLTNFLLGPDVPSERGHIVYRSVLHRMFNFTAVPDYETPVLGHEATQYFEDNPDAVCCFVPDGKYVRAPDDDQVSRKFVKQLFIPVTKDDQLLAEIPEVEDDDEKYNPYGDEEVLNSTNYTVVYEPPRFKDRLIVLLGLMWAFSVLTVVVLYGAIVLIGTAANASDTLGTFHLYPGWSSSPFRIDVWKMTVAVIELTHLPSVWNALAAQREAITDNVRGRDGGTWAWVHETVATSARNLVNFVHSKRDQLQLGFVISSYAVSELIIVVFGIMLPGKVLEGLIETKKTWWIASHLALFRTVHSWFMFLSMMYMSGIVVKVNPRFTVTHKVRYRVLWVGLIVWLILFAEITKFIWFDEPPRKFWVPDPRPAGADAITLILHWMKVHGSKFSGWHIARGAAWITFVLEEFYFKSQDYFGKLNAQLKEEYYGSEKVLANAEEDGEDGEEGDGIGPIPEVPAEAA